jgi:hypothetical protein
MQNVQWIHFTKEELSKEQIKKNVMPLRFSRNKGKVLIPTFGFNRWRKVVTNKSKTKVLPKLNQVRRMIDEAIKAEKSNKHVYFVTAEAAPKLIGVVSSHAALKKA